MNWEQKLEAMNALGECSLRMRKAGDWYVHQNTEMKEGRMLCSHYGNGATPEEAVNDHWRVLAEASSPLTPIVINAYGESRREVYWNGFMWNDVPIKRTSDPTNAGQEP